ncbi:MAG: DUF479 domain-containing protein [Bacteroidetes bacterium]|nr:DUF479 domain-containing protein [Bacteroidota bacterium]
MNFLAHLYLSGENKPLRIGNFIADHIKGKAIDTLPDAIKEGVFLHRKIDHFTDHHQIVEKTKARLRPHFKKYSGVVADVFYDHFLAAQWDHFSDSTLEQYAADFYAETEEFGLFLPERTVKMLSFMISGNWLVNYSSIEGIEKTLSGMSRRTPFESGMEFGGQELRSNYSAYEKEFHDFFPELIDFVKTEIK